MEQHSPEFPKDDSKFCSKEKESKVSSFSGKSFPENFLSLSLPFASGQIEAHCLLRYEYIWFIWGVSSSSQWNY